MMVFKKAFPRRKFLNGFGVALALPFLDSMVPAFGSSAEETPIRLGIVYAPNGMWPMDKWTPEVVGTQFELSPTLEPLSAFRNRLLVMSGLAHKEALALPGEATADHSTAFSTFLTGVHPKQTSGKDFRVGISMDQ